ncbi:hypothetical protein DEM34_08460 [Spiribacter halobius]|uniref:RND transporter n=1 Tax=Sediminicurvatus halobius TaxID=2182432 RepID=A0A2U2N2C0_9GAMM|nr:hypothetical protein DEM34_08460 [Spiribacter halobius]
MVGIFMILSCQFRCYLEPVIVMVSMPLAFMGAVWGRILTGCYLSTPSLIAAAALAGIVTNDAILLVQFVKIHWRLGLGATQAAIQARRDRLRAIFIFSSPTIAGVLPILLETSR